MSNLIGTHHIGDNTIEVWGDCVRTILPDGSTVVAAPNSGETLQDTIDHEASHTFVAWSMGMPYSRVMYAHRPPRRQPHR
jgi:hypothetical protein